MNVQNRILSACDTPKDACCAECGGLECQCRPRFFHGMLMTDETMNLLVDYVRGRLRMHNLSLHGTGVVNGLKVLCDPCGEVKVTIGHAISPCGDDIIVCEDTAVPVCELIRKCRNAERKVHDCDPPRSIPSDCADLEEEWVLAIKYDERPTRGVVPLRGAGTCQSCGCGASTCACDDCGCDACCEPAQARQKPLPRTAPPTCEPTVICEGYRFCVYRKPEADDNDDPRRDGLRLFDMDSPIMRQLRCCIELLIAAIPSMPQIDQGSQLTQAERRGLQTFCCRLRENLLAHLSRYQHTNCELAGQIAALRCPNTDRDDFAVAWTETVLALFFAWLDIIRQCFCLALLPPAPRPGCEDRVALATVRVRQKDCKVLSVCNWTVERDMLVSWPAVTYWLGALGIWDVLRELLDRICCNSLFRVIRLGDDQGSDFEPEGSAGPVGRRGAAGEEDPNDDRPQPGRRSLSAGLDEGFAAAAANAFDPGPQLELRAFVAEVTANFDDPARLSRILNAASPRFRMPLEGRPLGESERANLPELLTVEVIAKPVLSSLLGIGGKDRGPLGQMIGAALGSDRREDEIARLREDVSRQQADIAALKRAVERLEE